jgi:hypothetical protein
VVALKLSVTAGELGLRLRERLRGNAVATATKVTWQRPDGQRLLIELASVKVRLLDGWLLCELAAQTDQTGRAILQFVFFVGRPKEADDIKASSTINAATPAATQIAAVWGQDLQRVIWDVVLDVLEACVWQVSQQQAGKAITIQGFHCTPDLFHAEVIAEPPTGVRK